MSKHYKNISQLSEMTNLDRATIRKRLAGLKPHSKTDNLVVYDCHEAFPLLFAEQNQDLNLLSEHLRYSRAKADKMVSRAEQLRNELVPVSDVKETISNEYQIVRTRIRKIAKNCIDKIAKTEDAAQVQIILSEAIREALTDLSSENN